MLDNLIMQCLLNLRLNQACKKEKCLTSFEKTGLNAGERSASNIDCLVKNHLIVDNTDLEAQNVVKGRTEVYRSQEFDKPSNAKASLLEGCCRVDGFRHHHQFCSVYPSQDRYITLPKDIRNYALNFVSIVIKQLYQSSLCYNPSWVAKNIWHS